TGPEADNLALAQARAETVREYLHRIWAIAPQRMRIEARNLPEAPSAPDTRPGRLENQRVEFVFSSPAAREQAMGALIAETDNRQALTVRLDLDPRAEIRSGEILIQGEDRVLTTLPVPETPARVYAVPLDTLGRQRLAGLGAVEAQLRIDDGSGRRHEAASDLCHIRTRTREVIHALDHPPFGTLRLEPKPVTVEEVTVVDSSPLLPHIYFDAGRSEIPERYSVFATPAEARAFDETTLSDAMEKYRHLLNIIGKRAAERPRSRLTLTGCTSDTGAEKGNLALSRRRAEAVRAYWTAVWGIDSARVRIDARGLPAAASSPDLPEGRAENQRVEITADDPAILDTVQSTRIEALSQTERIRIVPEIEEGLTLTRWRLAIYGDGERIEALDAEGPLEAAYVLSLKEVGLLTIGRYRSIAAELEGVDAHGRRLQVRDSSEVQLLRREERLARREGYRVVEKYALILFDFNRAEIGEHNRSVVARIGARLKERPGAVVRVIGHTDSIGSFDYNLELARKRARSAYDLLLSAGVPARDRISHEGKGPAEPLYDNRLPEGRAYNRTVAVILDYEEKP
ncbi:MAG: OmpA family protein, partial [Desulfobacterales bacterium]|nr:OmpA family protein [Desulfobacterales bacterium]